AELHGILDRYRGIPAFTPVLLAENLTLAQVARFGVNSLELPEFTEEVQHLRLYRHGAQTAAFLGYLGEVTQAEIDRSDGLYKPGDLVGKKGIEQAYDAELRGENGERAVVVDSRGELLEEFGKRPAVPGKTLKLTIDLELQQEAARWLEGPEKVGAIVAMDPRNGEILALVSSPGYNPNLFARRLQADDWNALLQDPYHPLQNRAIKNSCDVFFYTLGQKMGIERIARYSRMFGLGSLTGIDISGEKKGLVPDHDWALKSRGFKWYAGETISVSIGQGPVLMTPRLMASMTAMIANGGYRVTPHLVEDADVPPPVHVPLDARALRIVREGMWAVVNEPGGTAYGSARVPGAEMAGKTGTVQVIAQAQRTEARALPFKYRDHAWFTSFAPVQNPEIVVAVFAEHGGSGSRSAAPIAQAIHAKYFKIDLHPAAR